MIVTDDYRTMLKVLALTNLRSQRTDGSVQYSWGNLIKKHPALILSTLYSRRHR